MQSSLRLAALLAATVLGAACVDTDRPQDDLNSTAAAVADAPPPQLGDAAPLTAEEVAAAQRLEEKSEPATATAAPVKASSPARPAAKADTTRPAPARRRVTIGPFDLTNVGYDKGDPAAPVVMINLSDFGCQYCAQFGLESFPELEREFIATGKVYYKYVPFVMGMFPNGQQAARAGECAAEQGKFWPMASRLYATQRGWKAARDPFVPLAEEAGAAGLDTAHFRRCFNDHRTEPRTRRASNIAADLGVRATPTFVINGRALEGALPLPEFRRILDAVVREASAGKE